MRISNHESERAILKELGDRIKQQRIAANITQTQLAERCGISVSTEVRIENGEDSKFSNIIKIMAVLDLTENFNSLIPETTVDYKAIFEGTPKRKRASATKEKQKKQWVWGEDK